MTADAPTWFLQMLAASHLTITGPTIDGTFEGERRDGRLEGTWVQGGVSLPLVFARSSR